MLFLDPPSGDHDNTWHVGFFHVFRPLGRAAYCLTMYTGKVHRWHNSGGPCARISRNPSTIHHCLDEFYILRCCLVWYHTDPKYTDRFDSILMYKRSLYFGSDHIPKHKRLFRFSDVQTVLIFRIKGCPEIQWTFVFNIAVQTFIIFRIKLCPEI